MKFDDLVNKLLSEEEMSFGTRFHVYDMTVSGMHSETPLVDKHYELSAKNMKDAQAKVLGNYAKEVELDEFAEIVPAKSEELGIVITGEEGMIVVSKNELSEEQLADIVMDTADEVNNDDRSEEASEYEHKGWPGDGSGESDLDDLHNMEGYDN